MKKIDFPRYLASPRLFFLFESDEVIIAVIALLGSFFILGIILGINIILTLLTALAITYFSVKNYIKYSKKQSPGFLKHKLYEAGFFKSSKGEKEPFVPYGFEDKFID